MKWMQLAGAAILLCGAVLLSACGGEAPASAAPPSSEAPAVSQPVQPEAPPSSETASSSATAEPASSSEEKKPWDDMIIPAGCKAEWQMVAGELVLKKYDVGNQTAVILPTGKPYRIEMACFAGNFKIKSVVFPEDVFEIGLSAFRGCAALRQVDFSQCRRLKIGTAAFENTALEQVVLPECVREMGTNVFAECTKLTDAGINGLTEIPEQTFARCSSLHTVRLGLGVTRIGVNAFYDCPLETIYYSGDWDTLVEKSDLTNKELLESAAHDPTER